MKRVLSWILALMVVVSLTACGSDENGPEETVASGNADLLVSEAMTNAGNFLYSNVPEPTFGSLGGEWMILGMARSGMDIPDEYFEIYFENLSVYTAQQGGVLHAKKYTEYSRVILAVTSIGKDPADVGGYNLLVPLADFEQTVFQGINGPVFALLALDSGSYEIPENQADSTQATRDMYVDYILNAQLSDGGWSLAGGTSEIDITAMVLQALAKYQDKPGAAQAIERGVKFLSDSQNVSGGFTAYDADSSESVAQVIVALTELGIDLEDDRFVKNGNSLVDRLLQFQLEDGSFSHLLDGDSDQLATEQAFYALVAAKRLTEGESSLYSMK